MNYRKILTSIFVILLIISDALLVFGKELIAPYISIVAVLAIFSGVGLFVMVIVNRKGEKREL